MQTDAATFGAELAELAVAEIQAAALTIAEARTKADRLADIAPRAHRAIEAAAVDMVLNGTKDDDATAWAGAAHAAFLAGMEAARAEVNASPISEAAAP